MSRGGIPAIVLSVLAAVLVQPVVFWLWLSLPLLIEALRRRTMDPAPPLADMLFVAPYIVAVALAFILVLGLPIFFLLRRSGRATAGPLAAAGFLAAAVPFGILAWPLTSSRATFSAGGNWWGSSVDFVVQGKPTIYGWLSYLEGVAEFGIQGMVGALVFLAVWRRIAGRRAADAMKKPLENEGP